MRVPRAELAAAAGPTARAIPVAQPALMLGLTAALVLWRADTLDAPGTAVWTVRASALVLTAGALAAFDDPAAPQVAAVPLPTCWRMAPRLLFALTLVIVPVALLAAQARLPSEDLALEAAALLTLAVAACLLLAGMGVTEASTPVAVGLLLAPAAMFLLPERAALLVPPGPLWGPSHGRWAVLLGVGLLLLARSMRDPARPSRWAGCRTGHRQAPRTRR